VKKFTLGQKNLLKGLKDLEFGLLSEEMLQEKGTMIFRDAFMVRCFEFEKEQILN